ncbi:phosphoesterase family protein [Staphylococcus aureus]|uniref:Phosphoesterase family protein n=1 Tax=Staphylococcus aureus TaxID=1280 RepID=A0A2X2K2Y3_STAAU|nr:phosphoesterase family protein [Staphylococcus aureus]
MYFAFYGHTHVAKYEYINGVHVINPGSISQSRSSMEESYAEVLIDDQTLQGTVNFKNDNMKQLVILLFKLKVAMAFFSL